MNMVEKLARTLYEEDAPWSKVWPWPNLTEPKMADKYSDLARAVLTALSEPTPAMVATGADNVVGCCLVSLKDAREIWQAMLTAASKD